MRLTLTAVTVSLHVHSASTSCSFHGFEFHEGARIWRVSSLLGTSEHAVLRQKDWAGPSPSPRQETSMSVLLALGWPVGE